MGLLTGADGSVRVAPHDQTAQRARALGIAGSLGEAFPCRLPEHDHAAVLRPTAAGYWKHECDDPVFGRFSLGLADVRAALAYGGVHRVSNVEAARWRERLDFEAGLRARLPVQFTAPPGSSSAARSVAEGIDLLLALRDDRWGDQPFTFARDFATAWCGLTDQQARDGVQALRQSRAIVAVGKRGRAIEWQLASRTGEEAGGGRGGPPPLEPPTGPEPSRWDGEDDLMDVLRREFDAVEVTLVAPPCTSAGVAPCPFPSHRPSDWRRLDGRLVVCGVCHPPPFREYVLVGDAIDRSPDR